MSDQPDGNREQDLVHEPNRNFAVLHSLISPISLGWRLQTH